MSALWTVLTETRARAWTNLPKMHKFTDRTPFFGVRLLRFSIVCDTIRIYRKKRGGYGWNGMISTTKTVGGPVVSTAVAPAGIPASTVLWSEFGSTTARAISCSPAAPPARAFPAPGKIPAAPPRPARAAARPSPVSCLRRPASRHTPMNLSSSAPTRIAMPSTIFTA